MKNKITMLAMAFLAGAIIGAGIFWLICNCCCKGVDCSHQCIVKSDSTGLSRISLQTKKDFLKAYLQTPTSVDTLVAFTINYQQFNAMKIIASRDSTVHGFRIYMGMDKNTPVRMVVGTGSPDKTEVIFATSDLNSGPCPRVCDDGFDNPPQ